jgi:hypothetical protein
MEVACSKCGAKGRVPDERLASGPLSVRCSACQSVLRVGNPKANPNGPSWFFDVGQGAQGPYRIDELIALWHGGKLGWDSRLWREGDAEWAVARGHGPFIDAIFAHNAGAPARNDALAAARRDANSVARRDQLAALAAPGAPPNSAAPNSANADRTDPQLTPPRHVPDGALHSDSGTAPALRGGASSSSITEPRTPDVRDRAAHDSLAPFERASRVPGRRWSAAILAASTAIAAAVLVWAVRSHPKPEVAAITSAPNAAHAPAAITSSAALAREHADVEAAVAEAHEPAPSAASTATAVPADPIPVPAATLPAAQARPLRSSERPKPVAAPPASEDSIDTAEPEDRAQPEDPAGDDDPAASEPSAPKPAPDHAPDFLTTAAPLPDTPTTLQIASAMRAVAPAVRACANGGAPGTVYVSVAIKGATGKVSKVGVPSVDASLEHCIAQAVQTATFPRFDRPELELRFPFLLGQ